MSAAIVDALTDDGDRFTLPSGREVTLRIFPDEDTTIEDYDECYGVLVWPDRYGRQRPAGIDGGGELLSLREGRCWWQPPRDVLRMGRDAVASLRRLVLDVCEMGWCGVAVEVGGREASLWGVEPGSVAEVVAELLDELAAVDVEVAQVLGPSLLDGAAGR